MKLNRLERYTAYCILLQEAESKDRDGICWEGHGICFVYRIITGKDHCYDHFESLFPELWNKMEGFKYRYFRDWSDRIAALKACIEETHPDNPKNKRK